MIPLFTHPLPEKDINHVWQLTEKLWTPIKGKSIFITGGTGFFGIWLIETLIAANKRGNLGLRIVVLSRAPSAFLARMPHIASCSAIEWLQGDICDFIYPTGAFEYMIHAAAQTAARSDETKNNNEFNTMISGTKRVLEFVRVSGVSRMLFTSSGAVYGSPNLYLKGIPENCSNSPDSLDPSASYGIGKRASEHLCMLHSLSNECQISIARCFAFVGPHIPLNQNYAVGNFIRDGLSGKPLVIKGDGQAIRSYLYAADLMVWLWTLLFRGIGCKAYNVGSANPITIFELAREVSQVLGLEPPSLPPASMTKTGSVYYPDVSNAARELGLQQRIPLPEGIRRTIEWYNLPKI